MKKLLLVLLCLPMIGFGQTSEDAMQKLRNIKELLELNLITQIEYDSISVELKNIIINSNSEVKKISSNIDDGFYYNGNINAQHYFSTNCLSSAIEENATNKELIKIVGILGRETERKNNTPLFYIYDDGKVEKKIIIE